MGAIERYNNIENEIKSKDASISELENMKIIKDYKKLVRDRGYLLEKKLKLIPDVKFEEYDICARKGHLLALVKGFNNIERSRFEYNRLCVKCGLTTLVKDYHKNSLDKDQKIMWEYFSKRYSYFVREEQLLPGTRMESTPCDPYLAVAIYKEIIKLHPDIDDQNAAVLFDETLKEINSLTNEKDKKEYAKRLGLNFKSIKW